MKLLRKAKGPVGFLHNVCEVGNQENPAKYNFNVEWLDCLDSAVLQKTASAMGKHVSYVTSNAIAEPLVKMSTAVPLCFSNPLKHSSSPYVAK